jgi:transketolase
MRNIFIKTLIQAAKKDPDFILLTGDLGYGALEEFRDSFPGRFFNAGVAEANMVGMAAGLALSGKKVCIYSIAPFLTFKIYEQLRNDVCAHNLNINLIATGGGFSYGPQGLSHNTTEDLAIMRALPNMTILIPADKTEAEVCSKIALAHSGPVYLRLGKAGTKEIHPLPLNLTLGRGILVKDGYDFTLIGIGNIMEKVLEIAENFKIYGNKTVRVISLPCLKPLDAEIIKKAAWETRAIFTVEEHSLIGGLGGAVAEILMEAGYPRVLFKRFAVKDSFYHLAGSQEYLRNIHGLSVQKISEKICHLLKF